MKVYFSRGLVTDRNHDDVHASTYHKHHNTNKMQLNKGGYEDRAKYKAGVSYAFVVHVL